MQQEQHLQSVFSEYESEKINPTTSKNIDDKMKEQWGFMHASEIRKKKMKLIQISFSKTIEYDQENNSMLSNTNNQSTIDMKNKSYINAMIALQEKVKCLEQNNMLLERNLNQMNKLRNRSISASYVLEEQLVNKLKEMELKTSRFEEMIQQNKILRQTRDEKNRKIKQLEKNNKQIQAKNQDLSNNYNKLSNNIEKLQTILETLNEEKKKTENELKTFKTKNQDLEHQLKELYGKNRIIQEMKEKSTVSLLEKYNDSILLIQKLQRQNGKLKNQIQHLNFQHTQQLKKINHEHQDELKKCLAQSQKMKQTLFIKDRLIIQTKKEVDYYKEVLQKREGQLMNIIKNNQNSQKQYVQKLRKSQICQNIVEIKVDGQQYVKVDQKINTSCQVENSVMQKEFNQLQNIIPVTCFQNCENKKSFIGVESSEEQQLQQNCIPYCIETKSVQKSRSKKKQKKKNFRNCPQKDKLQKSEGRRENQIKRSQKNQNITVSPNRFKSKSNHKNHVKKTQKSSIAKSEQNIKTQNNNTIRVFSDFQSASRINKKEQETYFYSAKYPPHSLSHQSNRYINSNDIDRYKIKNNTTINVIDQAVLIQLQRQLLQLYEQQQNLILASNDEYCSHEQRAEFVGRLKQINQHLRIKNQKICDLKNKI